VSQARFFQVYGLGRIFTKSPENAAGIAVFRVWNVVNKK